MNRECQLFVTSHCALCEEAEAVLMPLVMEYGLLVELIDITEHPALYARYEQRIPVLRRVDTGEEIGWPFDTDQVARMLP